MSLEFGPEHEKAFATSGRGILGSDVHIHYTRDQNLSISDSDFCELVKYFLTNTDLTQNDPRVELIAFIATLSVKEGFNGPRLKGLHND